MTTMATTLLSPADKAVLAMTSSEYLNMADPNDMDPYSPSECSPVSSVFSADWSRRPSASSMGSHSTDDDEVDECPNENNYQPAKHTQTTQSPCLESPEALTVGACIVHLNQETLEPAVLMVRQGVNHNTYPQAVHEGLWHFPRDVVSKSDSSISDAMARITGDQTALSIRQVVGVLPETRHHLHQSQGVVSRRTSISQEAVSLDFTCAATAASLAAAHAARMARNVSVSTTDCNICDFMPASKRRDALLNWRKMARRNRANSTASRWSRYSDSSSSSASEGAASDSDESTCRLLRDESTTTTTTITTNNTITAAAIAAAKSSLAQEQEQETDGALYMKIPPKSARNSRKTSPTRLRVKYKPLAQDPPPANIEEDSSDTTGESESDDFRSDDDDGAQLHQVTSITNTRRQQTINTNVLPIAEKKHLEAIQLTYIVLAAPRSNRSAETPITTIESVLATNETLSLITATNLEAYRMSPQTRKLVRQALNWASGYFYPICPLDGDDEEPQREEEVHNFADGEDSESEAGNESEDDSTSEGVLLSPRQSL